MEIKNAALVLSGGGAKGYYQYKVAEILRNHMNFNWIALSGVSVGSLNGFMIAQELYTELDRVWNSINPKDVYKKGFIPLNIIKMLFGRKGLYDNSPLKKLIQKYYTGEFKIPFYAGYVDLITGLYYSKLLNNCNEDEVINSIWASTTIPMIWSPVCIQGELLVDGGVRNITPIGSVLRHNPDYVVIINCSNKDIAMINNTKIKNIIQVASRTIDIMTNEIFRGDLNEYLRVNDILKQLKDETELYSNHDKLKYYKTILIEPSAYLGDTLDFSEQSFKHQADIANKDAFDALTDQIL